MQRGADKEKRKTGSRAKIREKPWSDGRWREGKRQEEGTERKAKKSVSVTNHDQMEINRKKAGMGKNYHRKKKKEKKRRRKNDDLNVVGKPSRPVPL